MLAANITNYDNFVINANKTTTNVDVKSDYGG